MKINIKVKPNSKQEKVEKAGDSGLILWLRAPAKEGKANDAVVKLLSGYFEVAKSRIRIVHGLSNRSKVVEIL